MRRFGRQFARFAGGAAIFLGVMMLFAGWYSGEWWNPWGLFVAVAGMIGGVVMLLSFDGPAWFGRTSVRVLGAIGVVLLATVPLTCKWLCA